jgi:hypothetical protein
MAEPPENARWYLFIHQLPPKPLYLRAKVRKLLSQAGALPLKDSVYVLPSRPDRLPTLQQIAQVASKGGEAFLWQGQLLEKERDEELVDAFQEARGNDYAALVERVREWTDELERRSGQAPPEGRVRFRLVHAKRRFDQIARYDFFGAPGRAQAEAALESLEARLQPVSKATARKRPHAELIGRTWVTRRGIQVDRIASAWLIRRFVDDDARFRFIDIHEEQARPGELTFDMVGADFTHEEDRCTFETLVRRINLKDPALARVAEIIHDIDIKDGKFGRAESRGVEQLVLGLLAANPEDERRLDRGFAMLDDLYRSFSRQLGPGSPGKSKDMKPKARKGGST